jgi:hypothetical protein
VAQDAVDDAGVGNKGDDVYAGAAGASQRIRFEDFLIKRAQVRRASLEESELSRASAAGGPAPGLLTCSPAQAEPKLKSSRQCFRKTTAP